MNSLITSIDHIQIAAPPNSEEEARGFYGEILGMTEIPKPENLQGRGGCWFQIGAQEVHIGIQEDFLPAKKAHPGFIVNALETLKLRLEKANYSIQEDAPINGRTRFFTNDPFGNRIEFLAFDY